MSIYIQNLELICVNNKYKRWYINIISNAILRVDYSLSIGKMRKQANDIVGYVEAHHILPKCLKLGGDSDKYNLVFLSAREHLICHWLLTKMFTSPIYIGKLYGALQCMIVKDNGGKNVRPKPKLYEYYKKSYNGKIKMFRDSHGVPRHLVGIITKSEFIEMLSDLSFCLSMQEPDIGKILNISAARVSLWKNMYNIQSKRDIIRDKILFEQMLAHYNYSAKDFANYIKCSTLAIFQAGERFSIPVPRSTTRGIFFCQL